MSNAAVPDSVSTLYQAHHGWLFGWLRRKTGCSQQAADLAQDTFLRLLLKRECEAFREPRAYLRTVAHGLMVDQIRRRTLEQAYLEALALLPEPVAPSPEERLLVIEALLHIDRLLDALPKKTRTVFLLSQLEGLSYPEIAEQLGIGLRSVKRYMHDGFAQCLRVLLT
ncbi:MAG: sigma-70 family RNA polymerase sigma factor [Azonexaceae bacterium]|uniref:sigma-70 family RNA polymerase sigma factor n=1 Tax=Azonexus sp. R2A61 TaxID=2744443 RepID=UPI001F1C4AEF|nr:sigma-70 family RNA polymerase sigma factor [Azonexus sp. R2A61]MCE1238594.1 sigma-70 family RNA polymerase sigma factor [Azonexaceae bacterium]